MRQYRWIMAAALGATVVLGPSIEAAGGKPREGIHAIVGGHAVRFKPDRIKVTSDTGMDFVVDGAKAQHDRVTTLEVGCPQGLALSGQGCSLGYSASKPARNLYQQWLGESDRVHVTIQSFDGARLQGTFDGMLSPVSPTPGQKPISIKKGTFDVPVH